jgi:hypothetical protein
MRKLLVGAVVAVVLATTPSAAWAHHCANFSRKGPTEQPFKGQWVYLPEIGVPIDAWGFGGGTLLDDTGACGNEKRQTTHGIQNEECLGLGL